MEELVQLVWFVLCCSANSCQSFSSCLHLQVWDFFWRLSEWKYYHRHFLKVGVDSGKMVLPISLSTARWMTATVYAWNPFKKNKSILLLLTSGRVSLVLFSLVPCNLSKIGRFCYCDNKLLMRGGLKLAVYFFNTETFGSLSSLSE